MPQSSGTFKCLLGPNQWDAVPYARYKTEDSDASQFIVPDLAYQFYVEAAAEVFSLHLPAGTIDIGNTLLQTSPLVTVANQKRYILNSAVGVTRTVTRITDALWRATGTFSAGSEVAYLALLPFSPINRFLFTPSLLDSPSERILRDEYLSELDKYGLGFVVGGRDPNTGLMAVDLYPIPLVSGLPIYVQYEVGHQMVQAPGGGDFTYPTVPDDYKFSFAKLLLAEVLEQEGIRLARMVMARAGMTQLATDPRVNMETIRSLRDEALGPLGANVTAAIVAH